MSMSTFGFATPPLRAENSAQSRRSASGGRAPCPQGEGHITAVPSAASRPPAQLATSYQFWRDITDKRDVKVTKFDRKSKSTPELMGSEALTDKVDMQTSRQLQHPPLAQHRIGDPRARSLERAAPAQSRKGTPSAPVMM